MAYEFTAHNILLPDGTRTRGNNEPLQSESNLWKSIEKTVDLFFPMPKEQRKQLRVIDLGCLEGGYSVEFAKMGFTTVGIDAREVNIEKCNWIRDQLKLSNLSFVTDNVRNLTAHGKFDIVLNYGLLYHLNDPFQFTRLTYDCMTENSLQLFNTHFAPERDLRYSFPLMNRYLIAPLQKRMNFFRYTQNYRLSRLTTNEGYRGRWYHEWSPAVGKKKIEEKYLLASYDNQRSFWMLKKELTTAMHDAGFNHVFEQFDFTGDIYPHKLNYYNKRGMFVALKGFKPKL